MGHHVQGFMLDIDLVKGSTADDYLQLQASFLENKENSQYSPRRTLAIR